MIRSTAPRSAAVAAVGLPLELAGGVGVGVDRDVAALVERELAAAPGGSSRSGRQLISTAVSNRAQAANTNSASNVDWRAACRSAGRCSGRGCRRGARLPATHHPLGHRAALHAQLGVHAGDDDVEPASISSSRSSDPSSRMSTSIPVRMRNGARLLVERGHVVELLPQSLAVEAVGDGEPGRVIGEHHVVVAERDRRRAPSPRSGPAVAPQAVQVAVAAERGAVAGPFAVISTLVSPSSFVEIGRDLAVERLADHRAVASPMPVELGQRARSPPARRSPPAPASSARHRSARTNALALNPESVPRSRQCTIRCRAWTGVTAPGYGPRIVHRIVTESVDEGPLALRPGIWREIVSLVRRSRARSAGPGWRGRAPRRGSTVAGRDPACRAR